MHLGQNLQDIQTTMNKKAIKIGAILLILAYPIYAIIILFKYGIHYKSSLDYPSALWYMLICAGLTIVFYGLREFKECDVGYYNFLAYFILFLMDICFDIIIKSYYPIIITTISSCICIIYFAILCLKSTLLK